MKIPSLPHRSLLSLFVAFILLSVVSAWLAYGIYQKVQSDITQYLADHINRRVQSDLRLMFSPSQMSLNLLQHNRLKYMHTLKERWWYLPMFHEVLLYSSTLNSVYIGYDNGDYFGLYQTPHGSRSIEPYHAPMPDNTTFIVFSIETQQDKKIAKIIYLDRYLNILEEEDRPDYGEKYDPRSRIWYKTALESQHQIITAPYSFFPKQEIGTSLAVQVNFLDTNGKTHRAVIGADIILNTLNELLNAHKPRLSHSQLAIVNLKGQVLAYSHDEKEQPMPIFSGHNDLPYLNEIDIPVFNWLYAHWQERTDQGMKQLQTEFNVTINENTPWRVSLHPIAITGGIPLYLVCAIAPNQLFSAKPTTALRLIAVAYSCIALFFLAVLLSLYFNKKKTATTAPSKAPERNRQTASMNQQQIEESRGKSSELD